MVVSMPKSKVAQIAIGDTIYYRSTEWEGSQYQKRLVVGETSRSWLLQSTDSRDSWTFGDPRYATKLPKSLTGFALGNEDMMKKRLWSAQHRNAIQKKLDWVYDPEVMIAVAQLLNYEVPEEYRQKVGQHEDTDPQRIEDADVPRPSGS